MHIACNSNKITIEAVSVMSMLNGIRTRDERWDIANRGFKIATLFNVFMTIQKNL